MKAHLHLPVFAEQLQTFSNTASEMLQLRSLLAMIAQKSASGGGR
jgi:hypothetical protein